VLERAASAQPAQFAGYWANIDFGFVEFEHLVSISEGYAERLQKMKAAHDRHLQEHGGPHNFDDVGEPYQAAAATTSRGDRKRMVSRARRALTRLVERALDMKLIQLPEHDSLVDRLKSS